MKMSLKEKKEQWIPWIVRTAMEPGASVTKPEEVIRHCIERGFPAVCLVEPGRMLAAARVAHERWTMATDGTTRLRVIAGSDLTINVGGHHLPCVAIPRTVEALRWLRAACTRSEGVDGPIRMKLEDLRKIGRQLVVMVRVDRKIIPRHILKALQKCVPDSFLALARPDADQERSGMEAGVLPIAAPDVVCMHKAEECVLSLAQELRGWPPVDPSRRMTLTSIRAVAQRFRGRLSLVRRAWGLLKLIEPYDLADAGPVDEEFQKLLASEVKDGLLRRDVLGDQSTPHGARLQLEWEKVLEMGLADQLLQARRLVLMARRRQVPVGPGAGTTPHLLLAWLLGICDLDPLAWDLSATFHLRRECHQMPLLSLHLGAGGKELLKERLAEDRAGLAWAYRVVLAAPDRLVDRLAHLRLYPREVLETLRTRLHQSLKGIRSQNRRPKGSFPLALIEREVNALATLCTLPWTLDSYDGGVVHDPSRRHRREHPVAPYEWRCARSAGCTAIEVITDCRLDEMDGRLNALDPEYRAAWVDRLQEDKDPKTILRAAKGWVRKRFPGIDALNVLLQRTGHAPTTFHDLVALAGLGRCGASLEEVVHHFRERSRMATNPMRGHPVLREILGPMRGRVLFREDAVRILLQVFLREATEGKEELPEDLLDIRWWERRLLDLEKEREASAPDAETDKAPPSTPRIPLIDLRKALARAAHVPIAKSPLNRETGGMTGLRSSVRKRRYRRAGGQNPPSLSFALSERLAMFVLEALKRDLPKAPAIVEAEMLFREALLARLEWEARVASSGGDTRPIVVATADTDVPPSKKP